MMPEGAGTSGVMIWLEALGEHEDRDQLPARPQAPAGSVLERAIKKAGFSREQFTITNSVWCRPPKNELDGQPWEHAVVEHCYHYNDALVAKRKPRVILACGNVAMRALTHFTGVAKEKQSNTQVRGYAVPSRRYPDIHVIPTYHPSFVIHNPKYLGVLIHDIRLAVQIASKGTSEPPAVYYSVRPTYTEAEEFYHQAARDASQLISFDIETPWSKAEDEDDQETKGAEITTVQFSLGQRTGISLRFEGEFQGIIRRILDLPNPKISCNGWQFDEGILQARECPIRGTHHDLRWAFHRLYPDLPTNLQFIASFLSTGMKLISKSEYDPVEASNQPWKHTAHDIDPDNPYGCIDVDLPHRIWSKLVPYMKSMGCWRSYEEDTLELRRHLVDATVHGVPIDVVRHAAFREQLDKELVEIDVKLQAAAPPEILGCDPKHGYKNPKLALKRQAMADQGLDPDDLRWEKRWFEAPGDITKKLLGAEPTPEVEGKVERWVRVKRFLPESSDQVLAYIKHRKHKVPKRFGEDIETTGKLELTRLWRNTKDDFYRAILESRAVSEMRGTHIEGWKPATDGCVHPRFTFSPATGQFACYGAPNALNPPKPKGKEAKDRLAHGFRKIVRAPHGCRMWEFDLKSAHALTLGFEAQDPDYMRLARIDVHAYFAAHLEKVPDVSKCLSWSDEDLTAFLADVKRKYKSTRDDKAKPAILGIGFGQGPRRLYHLNMETIASEKEAKGLKAFLEEVFPKIFQFQKAIKSKAASQGYLLSKHGFIRWFFDVLKYSWANGQWEAGSEAEAAIAYEPSNDAFGYMNQVILRLGAAGVLERAGFIIPLHDALHFCMMRHMEDELVPLIDKELVRPSQFLIDPIVAPGGLSIGCSASCGEDWDSMEEVKI